MSLVFDQIREPNMILNLYHPNLGEIELVLQLQYDLIVHDTIWKINILVKIKYRKTIDK